jgi:lipopolysaccharide/colanic/teichoic acid biosynthesis glycosyltransferase
MNIVGPRPLLTYEGEYFQDWHWQRQIVKPGITGLYQVSARGSVPFDEMVKMDIEYIRQRTLWLDLKIILLTVKAILKRTGG